MMRSICPVCRSFLSVATFNGAARHSTVILGNEEVPIIRFPVTKQKEYVKSSTRRKKKGRVIMVPKPGKLLVSASERKLNMYTNEFPTKFEPPVLASQTWTSHRSPGRHFTIHPTRENPSVLTKEKERTTFEGLNLSDTLIEALRDAGVTYPTSIQAKAIPAILDGENVMLAAETGSGKTYAYLLPLAQRLLQMEKEDMLDGSGPLALILTPSKELSFQVCQMTQDLNLSMKTQNLDELWLRKRKQSAKNGNILISTPILALAALRNRRLSLDDVRFVVVDECDTLLDESFSRYVCSILGRMNIKKGVSRPLLSDVEVQLTLCSATFPQYAEKALEDVIALSDISTVSTGYMHRISPHVTHKFLRVKASEKLATLLTFLQESEKQKETSMVFCNSRKSVIYLTKELAFHGLNVHGIHRELEMKDRQRAVEHLKAGETSVVVCTDVSSRGLDTKNVRHVINYEFPNVASDYIHRSGRVGRVGQSGEGRVTSLISKRYEVPLVMKIEEAARRRERIEGVNANIKAYHADRWDARKMSLEDELESKAAEQ